MAANPVAPGLSKLQEGRISPASLQAPRRIPNSRRAVLAIVGPEAYTTNTRRKLAKAEGGELRSPSQAGGPRYWNSSVPPISGRLPACQVERQLDFESSEGASFSACFRPSAYTKLQASGARHCRPGGLHHQHTSKIGRPEARVTGSDPFPPSVTRASSLPSRAPVRLRKFSRGEFLRLCFRPSPYTKLQASGARHCRPGGLHHQHASKIGESPARRAALAFAGRRPGRRPALLVGR